MKLSRVDVPEGRSGKWIVEKFTVTEPQSTYQGFKNRPVLPGTYTRLREINSVIPMMSDTDVEMKDHQNVLHETRTRGGRVLINGLGLGMVLKAILSFSNIVSVDVVEKEPDVIKLVAPTYQVDSRVNIILGNAFTIQWWKVHWNVVWHDIWPTISESNRPEIYDLKRKYQRLCDWQGSWAA